MKAIEGMLRRPTDRGQARELQLQIARIPYRTAGGPRMPASEKSSRAFGTTSCSRNSPSVASTGRAELETTTGLALCATTQIEQAAASVRVGWLWADSTATIHNIKDRQSQAGHLIQRRIVNAYDALQNAFSCRERLPTKHSQHSRSGIRLPSAYNGYPPQRKRRASYYRSGDIVRGCL